MRGDSGVADEGRVVGVPTFHSWGKRTILLTYITSNASSGQCITLVGYITNWFIPFFSAIASAMTIMMIL